MYRETLEYIRELALECKKKEDIIKLKELDIKGLIKQVEDTEERVMELRKEINTLQVRLSNSKKK